jgi:hypothetical protein
MTNSLETPTDSTPLPEISMPSEVFGGASIQRPDIFITKNLMVGNDQFNKPQPASADEYEQGFGHSETNCQLAWSS